MIKILRRSAEGRWKGRNGLPDDCPVLIDS